MLGIGTAGDGEKTNFVKRWGPRGKEGIKRGGWGRRQLNDREGAGEPNEFPVRIAGESEGRLEGAEKVRGAKTLKTGVLARLKTGKTLRRAQKVLGKG